MTDTEEYLARVRASMFGMEPQVREDILRELASHVSEAAAQGGDAAGAFSGIGDPRQVGRAYRAVYGYGRIFVLLFAAVAFLLAIPSSPVIRVTEEFPVPNLLAIPCLVALAAWLLWVSVAAGSRAGLFAGIAAFLGRLVLEVVLIATPPNPAPSPAGLALFLASGVLLVLIGWLPGTAKKVWSAPAGNL